LRNSEDNTVIEVSVNNGDLSARVNVKTYSFELLKLVRDSASTEYDCNDFILGISSLSEIRGWWWEKEKDFGSWSSMEEFVGFVMKEYAKKLNMNYVRD
jgi:hypothetical protein